KYVPLLRALFDRGNLQSRDELSWFMSSMDWDGLEGDPILEVDPSLLLHRQCAGIRQGERQTSRGEISGECDYFDAWPRQSTRHHNLYPPDETPGVTSTIISGLDHEHSLR